MTSNGALALLNSQGSYLATCYWGLYTSQITVLETTVLADLTEAAWAGYARQVVGTVAAPSLIAGVATALVVNLPTFQNTSPGNVFFAGWMLLDPTQTILLAGGLFEALQLIPAGAQITVVPAVSDRDGSF